jgi:hypothetical protein
MVRESEIWESVANVRGHRYVAQWTPIRRFITRDPKVVAPVHLEAAIALLISGFFLLIEPERKFCDRN